jgi:hypothetical protein
VAPHSSSSSSSRQSLPPDSTTSTIHDNRSRSRTTAATQPHVQLQEQQQQPAGSPGCHGEAAGGGLGRCNPTATAPSSRTQRLRLLPAAAGCQHPQVCVKVAMPAAVCSGGNVVPDQPTVVVTLPVCWVQWRRWQQQQQHKVAACALCMLLLDKQSWCYPWVRPAGSCRNHSCVVGASCRCCSIQHL